MQFQFFSILALGDDDTQKALNSFLEQHRIISFERVLVPDGARSFWAISVVYEAARPLPPASKLKIDYRDVLSDAEFRVYSRGRELRKALANRDGVAVYHVLTNEQLAEIVKRRLTSRQELATLSGFGPARLDKYGADLVEFCNREVSPLRSVQAPPESSSEGRD